MSQIVSTFANDMSFAIREQRTFDNVVTKLQDYEVARYCHSA